MICPTISCILMVLIYTLGIKIYILYLYISHPLLFSFPLCAYFYSHSSTFFPHTKSHPRLLPLHFLFLFLGSYWPRYLQGWFRFIFLTSNQQLNPPLNHSLLYIHLFYFFSAHHQVTVFSGLPVTGLASGHCLGVAIKKVPLFALRNIILTNYTTTFSFCHWYFLFYFLLNFISSLDSKIDFLEISILV